MWRCLRTGSTICTLVLFVSICHPSLPVASTQTTPVPTPLHGEAIWQLVWSPNGKLLLACNFSGEIQIRNLKGEVVSRFVAYVPNQITFIGWAWDSEHLLTQLSPYISLQFRDLQGAVQYTIDDKVIPQFSSSRVSSLAMTPDRHVLAIGHESGIIHVWNNQTKQYQVLTGHTDAITSLSWSSDGKLLASGSWDKTAKIWGTQGKVVSTLTEHDAPVTSVAWSDDDRFLLSSSNYTPALEQFGHSDYRGNGTVILWHPDGTLAAQITDKDRVIWAIWRPQQNTVITMSADNLSTLRFWNTKGELISMAQRGMPFGIGWSPDGNLLALGGLQLEIWTGNGNNRISSKTFSDIHFPLQMLTWSPDSQYLALGNMEGQVKIWKVDLAAPSQPL